MSYVTWTVGGTIAGLLLFWLVKLVFLYVVPQRVSGMFLLKQELSIRGVPYSHLPREFFEECVRWAERESEVPPGKSALARKAEFVKAIKSLASSIELWRKDPNSPTFSHSSPDGYRGLLEKFPLRDAA